MADSVVRDDRVGEHRTASRDPLDRARLVQCFIVSSILLTVEKKKLVIVVVGNRDFSPNRVSSISVIDTPFRNASPASRILNKPNAEYRTSTFIIVLC